MRFSARFPLAASASISKAVAFPLGEQHRRCVLRFSRRVRKTSWPSKPLANKEDVTCAVLPGPQSSYSCGSKPRCRPLLCAFRQFAFPPLLLLPVRHALVGDSLYAGNVFAQAAQLFQTFGLTHVHLKLQLEQLITHLLFLVPKFFVSQISDLFCLHKSS